jgi:hypothetical protein
VSRERQWKELSLGGKEARTKVRAWG